MASPQRRPGSGARRGDGDREEFEPRPKGKTVKMHPVVGVLFLIVTPLVLAAVFLFVLMSRGDPSREAVRPPEETNDYNKDYEKLKKDIRNAEKVYKEAMGLRESPNTALFKEKITGALDVVGDLLDRLDEIVAPHRDPETGELPDEYSGYQPDYDQLQKWQYDLVKSKPF